MESFWEWLNKFQIKTGGIPHCPATDKHGKCVSFAPNLRLIDQWKAEIEASLRERKRRSRDLDAMIRRRA